MKKTFKAIETQFFSENVIALCVESFSNMMMKSYEKLSQNVFPSQT